MITGDFSLTADAVVRKTGLIKPDEDSNIIKGELLDELSDDELKQELKKRKCNIRKNEPLAEIKDSESITVNG